jgi:ankyrin repeat protein
MSLSSLPSELIFNIADQLHIAEINALSHTNSIFYNVLNGYLYRRDITRAPDDSKSLLYGDPETTVPRAIAAGQRLHPLPESYNFALGVAARGGPGRVSLVKQLLKVQGINPNATNCQEGNTLISAAFLGETNIVRLLLSHPNIDPNFVERRLFGSTALMRAQEPEVTKLLLERGDTDVNLRDDLGWTALVWACYTDSNWKVNLLLERENVDPNIRDIAGVTALVHCCLLGPYMTAASRVANVRALLSRRDTSLDPRPNPNGLSLLDQVRLSVTPRDGGQIESLLRAAGA